MMTEEKLARRLMLRGAGAATAGLAVAGIALNEPAAADEHGGLTGSYLVTRHDDPPADADKALFVLSLTAGGVLITNDISPVGLVATGTWKRVGHGRFAATFWGGGAEGGPSGAFTVRVRARGHVEGHRIHGTFRFKVFDPTAKELQFEGTGSFEGTRIEP